MGIGIAASAVVNPKIDDWSRDVRNPIGGQYIGWGGDSVEPGQEDADIPPIRVVDYEDVDFNDTAIFVQATAAASSKGQEFDLGTGAVLMSDLAVQVEVGDWLWGAVPVA